MMKNEQRRTLTAEAVEACLNDLRARERAEATLEKYARALRAFYRWLPEGKPVDKTAVLTYKRRLAERRAPAGVNAELAALNSLFRFLGWEDCRVRPLRIQRRIFSARERELSRSEYERLVAAAERRGDRRLALLLQLMAATGLRASEVARITAETVRTGRAVIDLKGKVRTILLPQKLRRKLARYVQTERLASGPVFRTRSGRPLNRKEIWAQMKNLCRAAGVEPGKVFPHNLRHLFARVFYQAQKDIARLADLLGHSSVETTRLYLLSSGREHVRALDALHLVC